MRPVGLPAADRVRPALVAIEHEPVAIAGNRWRDQMVADLRKVMKLNRQNSLLKSGRVRESMLEHRAIMEAITHRDAKAAVKRMQEHFRNGLEAAA